MDLNFSRKKKQGISKHNLKHVFTKGMHLQHGEHFQVLKMNGYTKGVSGCCDFCDKICIENIPVLELVVKN